MRLLLVNPPIYDFTAYDFWSRPLGLLAVVGQLRGRAEMRLFDFMDRTASRDREQAVFPARDSIVAPPSPLGGGSPAPQDTPKRTWGCHQEGAVKLRRDDVGRGQYFSQPAQRPAIWRDIPRRYWRFGLPVEMFDEFLAAEGPFDFALIGTGMTYWYPGVREVIDRIRRRSPRTGIVLGGPYATLCPDHAKGLGADLVVQGTDLSPLWTMLGLAGDENQPPLWEAYPSIEAGVMRLTWGCPFRCTYCCVPKVYPQFTVKPPTLAQAELELLISRGARHVAFYDDALLHRPQEALVPFLEYAISRVPCPSLRGHVTPGTSCPRRLGHGTHIAFHTPNAINARLVTPDLAGLMVRAGFGKIYLGFESASTDWQQSTGGKVQPHELAAAVETLTAAGACRGDLAAYILLGHPRSDTQEVENSMRLANRLGIAVMLAEFSPIPGTPDGELFRGKGVIDLDEPLWHNKTACALATLGQPEVDRFKQLCRDLNRTVRQSNNGHHQEHEDHQEHQEQQDK